jgi:FkbM family methyltransferase
MAAFNSIMSFFARAAWNARYLAAGRRINFEMELDPEDPFDLRYQTRNFNRELVIALRQLLRNGDTVIDAGAQKGYVTLHAAMILGKSGKIISFEPDPRSFAILKRNCIRNHADNVELLPIALGDRKAVRSLKLSSQLGWTSFYPNKWNSHTTISAQDVSVERMDEAIAERFTKDSLDRLSFVKIDCEGSETEVVRGMSAILSRKSPLLWIEINIASLITANSSEQSLLKELSDRGYDAYLPAIRQSIFKIPFLEITQYHGSDDIISRRVFDVFAVKPDHISYLKRSGVQVADSQ